MITVLYHDNCTDGMMSGFLLYKLFQLLNIEAEFIPVNYGRDLPVIKGDSLYIVDFSYPKEKIDLLIEKYKLDSVVILDHHEKAANEHGGYGVYDHTSFDCNCTFKFAKERSGAGLVYDYIVGFHKRLVEMSSGKDNVIDDNSLARNKVLRMMNNVRLKELVDAVEDRDLWKFEYSTTLTYYELLNSIPQTFKDWDNLIFVMPDMEYLALVSKSSILVEFRDRLATGYASKAKMINFSGYNVPIVNCAANFSSIVGDKLGVDNPFAILFVTGIDIVFVSLRSNTVTGANVTEIAEKFGGGGHVNSAGFSIPIEKLHLLLSGQM